MKFFVTDREQLLSTDNPIVDSFATRAEAEAFIGGSEHGSEYQIEEAEQAADVWQDASAADRADYERQQQRWCEEDEAKEAAADTVNQWLADNPERLDYCYDNTTAWLDWKREAAKRLLANVSKVPAIVLGQWATEAEAVNA